eukprot:Selendium_serpulae@DN2864_c0_g1_i2.p1
MMYMSFILPLPEKYQKIGDLTSTLEEKLDISMTCLSGKCFPTTISNCIKIYCNDDTLTRHWSTDQVNALNEFVKEGEASGKTPHELDNFFQTCVAEPENLEKAESWEAHVGDPMPARFPEEAPSYPDRGEDTADDDGETENAAAGEAGEANGVGGGVVHPNAEVTQAQATASARQPQAATVKAHGADEEDAEEEVIAPPTHEEREKALGDKVERKVSSSTHGDAEAITRPEVQQHDAQGEGEEEEEEDGDEDDEEDEEADEEKQKKDAEMKAHLASLESEGSGGHSSTGKKIAVLFVVILVAGVSISVFLCYGMKKEPPAAR